MRPSAARHCSCLKKSRPKPRREGPPTLARTSPAAATFPIVGIGASAGGLAAFEAFFSGLPPDGQPENQMTGPE
jgi:two-component system CheB/CheR fusion protein